MLRAVGSESSLGAAGQANPAGGAAPQAASAAPQFCRTVSSADLSGSNQGGYLDRTESLQQLGLVPAAGEDVRVMVPSGSLADFETAVAGLNATEFLMPLQRPITLEQHLQLNSLVSMHAITREMSCEVLKKNAELRFASRPGSPAIGGASLAQGAGGNRNSASNLSGLTSSQGRDAQPAANQVPRSQSAARLGSAPRSTTAGETIASGDPAIVSTSASPTDEGRRAAAGGLNVERGGSGVNPHDERRSPWARFKASDYFPQRKLSYVYLGAVGFTGWWAGEVMTAVQTKMQDPTQPRGLLVTQLLAPFVVSALAMRIYLHMNKERKQDDEFAAMKNQLNTVVGAQDRLMEDAGARIVGPDNV